MKPEAQCFLEPITYDGAQREAIVNFFVNFENDRRSEDFWRSRLNVWWKTNPFYEESLPKGWILKVGGKIVGFLGVIVTDYLYQDTRYKALNMTTWKVLKEYRNYSMLLFLEFYSYRDKYILFNTTPNKNVEKIFETFELNSNTKILNFIFPIKCILNADISNIAIFFLQKLNSLILPKGNCRVIKPNEEIRLKELPTKYKNYLVKNRDADYLRWYCSLPFPKEKEIVGYFNKNNELSSLVIIGQRATKKGRILRILDYFVSDKNDREILAIINYICSNPNTINNINGCSSLVLSIFSTNEITITLPFFILGRKKRARHYYILPQELKDKKMLNYIAEGDVGL